MKNTWILTTGSSDIQLNTDDKWNHFYTKAKSELSNFQVKPQEVDKPSTVENKSQKQYAVPSRVLAKVYGKDLDQHYDKLIFPLLDGFTQKLQQKQIKIDRLILILTDQTAIFMPQKKKEKNCPYWQDTCENEIFFKSYFQQNDWFKHTELNFLTLQPEKNKKGLDDWNSVLGLVEVLITNISVESNEIIYLSHQAGTPAISSALQFVSLSQFNQQVNFLVSNEYNPSAVDIIDRSNYLRKLQIEKAKKLIQDGLPGAALILLEGLLPDSSDSIKELKELVDTFNIKATVDNKKDEFKPENAIERVRDALDLIEIFFKQENYLQGITLLSAAQETFLKAAVMNYLSRIKQIGTVEGINYRLPPTDIVTWTNQGLLFFDDQQQKDKALWKDNQNKMARLLQCIGDNGLKIRRKIEILQYLKFPVNESIDNLDLWNKFNQKALKNLKCTSANNALLLWLKAITNPTIQTWSLLDWIGTYQRDFEYDRRNQLMHNLRGVEKKDVVLYLYGYPESEEHIDDSKDIYQVYKEEVKKPFINALHSLGLLESNSDINSIEQDLQTLSNKL
ncbi:hypothetical protein PCC9214_05636 [Planktothrix tepida]|uniref:Uncharacterized protein n=1 Tax=Planktothrix tepida PCC 9214 TaxID=671072 RepID=A0A1J1LU47_9CYAN|nr:hypothetical protein [Planktothrix tepida]CAD5989723.1 hypothetical protein PCC9214_05636 [Planktothrix tepida]CUR35538.1 conserved hypothetical protein [Planktothrix tepida PCC 9214]